MMHARFFMLLFLLLAVSGHSVADSQVYIWQRVWNAGHEKALRQSHDLFSTLRVLGLQIHPQEGSRIARVDTPLLQQDGRPVWLVVRLDGSLTQLDAAAILPQIQSIIDRWRSAGVNLTAIEIDYDRPPRASSNTSVYLLHYARRCLQTSSSASPRCRPGSLHRNFLRYWQRSTVPCCNCTACCRRSRVCLTRCKRCAGAGNMH